MRWIRAVFGLAKQVRHRISRCLLVGLTLIGFFALLIPSSRGTDPTSIGRGTRKSPSAPGAQGPQPQREPIRIAQRREQNRLDPSIEETPPLPANSLQSQGENSVISEPDHQAPAVSSSRDLVTAAPPETDRPAAWPPPTNLIQQLASLAESEPACADWAGRVQVELEQLAALPSLGDRQAAVILARLSELAEESRELASRLPTEDGRSRTLRSGFAVVRRLAIWEPAYRAAASGEAASPDALVAAQQRMLSIIPAIESELPRTGDASHWRNYLLLTRLHHEIATGHGTTESARFLAREILYRLHSTQLSDIQAAFLEGPAFRGLIQELKLFATEPAELTSVLAAIEEYEQQEKTAAAAGLADVFDRLRWSTDPHTAEVAAALNTYYRNANVRVAVSAELVNRLLPEEQVVHEPVVDRIQGAHVEGASQTNTKIRLVLLPTRGQWEFGIEANGDVASTTTSSSGPARFHQNGWSNFRARKKLTVDRRGIRLFQAEAQANADTQLSDFETEFDGIPLLGSFARVIARNQYEQKSPAARHEVEGKISYRASAELDKQVAEKLEKGKQDFQRQMVQPLQKLHLEPTAVDMETTQDRLIARYRLAGRDQVSAYTPRPQAPGDSLLSVQIHESALNNVLSHLKLEGRRVDLVTLYREMAGRFSEKQVSVPEDIPDDVFVTFADADPVRIDCEDGRVKLTIQLKELEREGDRRWRNLTVRTYYAPDSNQLDANLVRDGIIEIPTPKDLPGRPLLAGIFGKVLSRNRKLNLINERISKSPQLNDQQVTQFVIHDGWIGVALGPMTPERQAQAAQRVPQ